MSEISLGQFKEIELRVAKVLDVFEVEGADRLWKLLIDLGGQKKEIVAGIKKSYPREALLGKNIVVVNNLAPAVIRGVESRGMLLAARDGEELALITTDRDVSAGSSVG
ncbi:MAG: methionine--tRNA ligase subunit beta [Candidatus Omnitrophica bacterium]|nr:methionine--tRNA ligase subunit beta [Candidatus Omnitrophota bacterium]